MNGDGDGEGDYLYYWYGVVTIIIIPRTVDTEAHSAWANLRLDSLSGQRKIPWGVLEGPEAVQPGSFPPAGATLNRGTLNTECSRCRSTPVSDPTRAPLYRSAQTPQARPTVFARACPASPFPVVVDRTEHTR